MSEQEQRAAVVAEARKWIGTPYHHMADVRGAGVDCGMLLIRVYVDTGVIAPVDPRPYPADWMLHNSEERYLSFIPPQAVEVDRAPVPGDAIVWLHGRTFSHGGIVTDWPLFVHAYYQSMIVEEADYTKEVRLQYIGVTKRPYKVFSPWG